LYRLYIFIEEYTGASVCLLFKGAPKVDGKLDVVRFGSSDLLQQYIITKVDAQVPLLCAVLQFPCRYPLYF
jgi:hypothetical protein